MILYLVCMVMFGWTAFTIERPRSKWEWIAALLIILIWPVALIVLTIEFFKEISYDWKNRNS